MSGGLDRLIAADLIKSPHERLVRISPWRAERATMALIASSDLRPADTPIVIKGRQPPIRLIRKPGICPVCGHARFGGGAWWSGAGARQRANASWHLACLEAWGTWVSPGRRWRALAARQGWKCAETGESLKSVSGLLMAAPEVDHVVPLWRIRADAAHHRWPDVLRFWGMSNLQALSVAGHRAKSAREAKERADLRRAAR